MPIIDKLLDGVSQVVTKQHGRELYISVLDMKYAYSQFNLAAETSKQCNFIIVGGNATGTYRFLTGFYGPADMAAEFKNAMDQHILFPRWYNNSNKTYRTQK